MSIVATGIGALCEPLHTLLKRSGYRGAGRGAAIEGNAETKKIEVSAAAAMTNTMSGRAFAPQRDKNKLGLCYEINTPEAYS
jgi:hypothetical protein